MAVDFHVFQVQVCGVDGISVFSRRAFKLTYKAKDVSAVAGVVLPSLCLEVLYVLVLRGFLSRGCYTKGLHGRLSTLLYSFLYYSGGKDS